MKAKSWAKKLTRTFRESGGLEHGVEDEADGPDGMRGRREPLLWPAVRRRRASSRRPIPAPVQRPSCRTRGRTARRGVAMEGHETRSEASRAKVTVRAVSLRADRPTRDVDARRKTTSSSGRGETAGPTPASDVRPPPQLFRAEKMFLRDDDGAVVEHATPQGQAADMMLRVMSRRRAG